MGALFWLRCFDSKIATKTYQVSVPNLTVVVLSNFYFLENKVCFLAVICKTF